MAGILAGRLRKERACPEGLLDVFLRVECRQNPEGYQTRRRKRTKFFDLRLGKKAKAFFASTASLVLAQVVDPVTTQTILAAITGAGASSAPYLQVAGTLHTVL